MTNPIAAAKLWRIKPLEWKEYKPGHWIAYGLHDGFKVHQNKNGRWKWSHTQTRDWYDCDSLSDGQSKCEALYAERMARGLEPVEIPRKQIHTAIWNAMPNGVVACEHIQVATDAVQSAIRTLAAQDTKEPGNA